MTQRAILIHGLSSSPESWWRVRAWLEEAGWQTETATLLGHGGRPPAPRYALSDYVDDLRVRTGGRDLVVGHSLGGSSSTVLAADPAWAARLVLIDPVWFAPPDQLPVITASLVAESTLTEAALRALKPHWDERDIAAKLKANASVDPGAVSRTFDVPEWDLRDIARTITTPTLVLGGDPAVYTMLEPTDGYDVAENAIDMEYVIVPGAAHSPHRDTPEATRNALLGWLARRAEG